MNAKVKNAPKHEYERQRERERKRDNIVKVVLLRLLYCPSKTVRPEMIPIKMVHNNNKTISSRSQGANDTIPLRSAPSALPGALGQSGSVRHYHYVYYSSTRSGSAAESNKSSYSSDHNQAGARLLEA